MSRTQHLKIKFLNSLLPLSCKTQKWQITPTSSFRSDFQVFKENKYMIGIRHLISKWISQLLFLFRVLPIMLFFAGVTGSKEPLIHKMTKFHSQNLAVLLFQKTSSFIRYSKTPWPYKLTQTSHFNLQWARKLVEYLWVTTKISLGRIVWISQLLARETRQETGVNFWWSPIQGFWISGRMELYRSFGTLTW